MSRNLYWRYQDCIQDLQAGSRTEEHREITTNDFEL